MALKFHFSAVCVIALCIAPTIAAADDFAPPPWARSHPNAITAEWEFFTAANPLPPDGGLTNVITKGSGTVPTSATIFPSSGGLGWGVGDGDGAWFFPPGTGGSILLVVDNIIDLEPVKHLWVQVTHTPGVVVTLDTMATANAGVTGSLPSPTVFTSSPDPLHTLFIWDMERNPSWEIFRINVLTPGEVDEIVVDTISIPEPASLSIFCLGAASLLLRARRR